LSTFYVNFQYIHAIVQLADSDWPGNIMARSYFRAQESQAMSLDGVYAISVSLAGHGTMNPMSNKRRFMIQKYHTKTGS